MENRTLRNHLSSKNRSESIRNNHYAIYTRQSIHDSSSVLSSCDVQFGICQDFAQSNLLPDQTWIDERFDDEGETGASIKRPALTRLLELAEKDAIETVIVYRLDRLSRNLRDCLSMLRMFREKGIAFHVVTAPNIGSLAADEFMLNLAASYAQFERDLIRSRFADARKYLKRQGRRVAGPTPYGYDSDSRTKQLVPNSAEATRIETIFQMAADGATPREIAEAINGLGWRTRPSASMKSTSRETGNLWSPRQILTTLHNPAYIGMVQDGDEIRNGVHPAIVSHEIFDRANQAIASRRTKKQITTHWSGSWRLRGKIECPGCGRIMSTHFTTKQNVINRHYRCRSYAGGKPPCKGWAFPAEEIEWAVAQGIGSQLSNLSESSSHYRELFEMFRKVWQRAGADNRYLLISTVVERVRFVPETSSVSVQLDIGAVKEFANWTNESERT